MKFEIKHRYTNSILFSGEFSSLRLCVEVAVSSRANLSRADLSGAHLSRATLSRATLSRAHLSGANLSGADLPYPIISVGPIGSRMAYLVYKTGIDEAMTGCFRGTLAELEAAVAQTHGDNQHGRAYTAAIAFLRAVTPS